VPYNAGMTKDTCFSGFEGTVLSKQIYRSCCRPLFVVLFQHP
jgi:hypothetical protein